MIKIKDLRLETIPAKPPTNAILMCDPTYFEVRDVKNAFMEGNINTTTKEKAMDQWLKLKSVFTSLGYPVNVVAAEPNLEDMVFTANQVLLGQTTQGQRYIVPSRMVHESRRKEVPFFTAWFTEHGYQPIILPSDGQDSMPFEGEGDALWHPGKQLLWGGFGHRTDELAYDVLTELLAIPIIKLKLVHPRFYHLDTAFCPLDEQTVMYYPGAFDAQGNELIRHFFKRIIEVPTNDAENFACNAVALGKNVVLQFGSQNSCQQLKQYGFTPVEVDTSQFMKSGGSVACVKMFIYQ